VGTFVDIYRVYEDPVDVDPIYMNHAHSDYVELALETGLPGVALILAFLLWWGSRTSSAWRRDKPDHFVMAASIASAAILAHSIVDYPLRTAAIGVVFACCCALLAGARTVRRSRQVRQDPAAGAKHVTAD
jgi:O-antigen ligase